MATIQTKDGTEIYYTDRSTGQPVVFSHGWPLGADAWEDQMLYLGVRGYRGRLERNAHVTYFARDQRHAWVQRIDGPLGLNGEALSAGDGAALDDDREVRLTSGQGTHFLLFDLD
jgi:redox-sensitive bicupin YhaK (pirin superfamily)